MDHKNEDISESVNSIDSGAIFLPRLLGQDLSRNVPVVSAYALQKKSSTRIGIFMTPKNTDFHEISIVFKTRQETYRTLL